MSGDENSSVTGYGYVLGGGAEFMYSSAVSLRVEALSYTLSSNKFGEIFSSTDVFKHNVVRAGASYHFN
jgi:opacity protein-like surface antigen